ncbi:unnamed protein product [[Candida] boidinii]|uniref:Unnamed protein product n=1 Tax=Candida boidinii TaxID=5477 RepID=A0ACB5U4S0_CANBO|nr:unnamed protein product [[Candida] boidinii]
MTPQQKQQFGVIFDNMDKSLKGSLTSAEVAQYLMTSKLPNDVLASVWELANLDGSDDFTKQEFSIAMFYVQRQLSGFPLPEETPLSLINSSRFDQEQTQHHESIPLPQARQYDAATTNTTQQPPAAPKARATTHLDDLLHVLTNKHNKLSLNKPQLTQVQLLFQNHNSDSKWFKNKIL